MYDQLPILADSEIEALFERARLDSAARHNLIGLVHHLFEIYRLDRREKNPNEYATRIDLADRFISDVVAKYKGPPAPPAAEAAPRLES